MSFFAKEDPTTDQTESESSLNDSADGYQIAVFQEPDAPQRVSLGRRAKRQLMLGDEKEVPPVENDGILTAEDVSTLDLQGTWLVTLSACDTGSGEARSGEGVMGLRRGFIEAGAQNLLMTLWPISDEVTVQIMSDFYDAAHKTGNAPKALADVQRNWLVKIRKEQGLTQAVTLAGPFIMSSQGTVRSGGQRDISLGERAPQKPSTEDLQVIGPALAVKQPQSTTPVQTENADITQSESGSGTIDLTRDSTLQQTRAAYAMTAFGATGLVPATEATAKLASSEADEQLGKKILGPWEERKRVTFLADGKWELQKNEDLPVEPGRFTWSVHDGKLTRTRDQFKFVEAILSLTATKLVLQSEDGAKPVVYNRPGLRLEPSAEITSDGSVARPDAVAIDRELNTVYNALRTRLTPAGKEQLRHAQLNWLRERDTVKGHLDTFLAFTVERIALLKSVLVRAPR